METFEKTLKSFQQCWSVNTVPSWGFPGKVLNARVSDHETAFSAF